MKAMVLPRIVSLQETHEPLELRTWPQPQAGPGQVRLRVATCGVCHTELDEIEGRTAPPVLPIVLGHEVVGYIDQLGPGVTRWQMDDRVGVGWIHHSCGGPRENVDPAFRATGRDVHGGYAEWMIADANYVFPIPEAFGDEEAAPLLCAGSIGYRSLKLTNLQNGQPLGLTGFGGSAHLVLQLAQHLYPDSPVYVFARDVQQQAFALQLGAVWAGPTESRAPEPLQAIIDTTPAWKPVVHALANLAPGGRLVINAIRKQADDQHELMKLSYHDHLWMEREVKSVANITGQDIAEFLPLAAKANLHVETTVYSLAEANRAIIELKQGQVRGAKVLRIGHSRRATASSPGG